MWNMLIFSVVLDVNRSLKRFPPGIEEAARPGLQEQLTRVIVRYFDFFVHLLLC